jgi:hypothetical protein
MALDMAMWKSRPRPELSQKGMRSEQLAMLGVIPYILAVMNEFKRLQADQTLRLRRPTMNIGAG